MIKCPYCGSTAQIKSAGFYHNTPTQLAEKFVCGCGCTIIHHYTKTVGLVYLPNGISFVEDKINEKDT